MRFSVVIPLYNKAPYIGATLQSVLAQSFSDFEVLVVDDGSSDGGGDIVAAVADPRVRVIRQANAGVAAARNVGIALASGEWVAFLDADDWWHPLYLSTQWGTIAAHAEVDIVATDFWRPKQSERWHPRAWAVSDAGHLVEIIRDLPARWTTNGVLSASSVAVRTSVLRNQPVCFPEGESYGEDLDLWFRLSERSPVALAHVELVAYRKGLPGSLASIQEGNTAEPPFLLRLEWRALNGSMPGRLRSSTLRLVNCLRVGLARRAIEHRRRSDAIRLLWRARSRAASHQWGLTALMLALAPGSLVAQWQRWRLGTGSARGEHALNDLDLT